jgi:inhibitor of KinA
MSRSDAENEIESLGDSALIVRVGPEGTPEQALNKVLKAKSQIEGAQIPGIIECTSAYTTVGVFYDPLEVVRHGAAPETVTAWLSDKIREALARGKRYQSAKSRTVEVPVCFDAEFAFDLEEIAARAGIAPAEVAKVYCSVEYRVSCIGFTLGFPYLIGLPKKLAAPRRAVPRKDVPAGSVAIGGDQTGIYPLRSPGGWNVIGRTPLRLFEPEQQPPALLRPGDTVRFRSISREEFAAISA